jgi:hypothetical protein
MHSTTILLLLGVCCVSLRTHAQEDNSAIQQWQSTHSSTIIISSERYGMLSATEQELLGEDLLVYENQLTLAQLENYSPATSTYAEILPDSENEQALFVKRWLVNHPDVTVVPKQEFTAMDDVKKLECTDNPLFLLLKGDKITAADIYYYEN